MARTSFVPLFLLFGSLLIGSCHAFPHPPVEIPPKNPNDPPTLPPNQTKKVLICGGGLAALSAALELAERGFSVV